MMMGFILGVSFVIWTFLAIALGMHIEEERQKGEEES